MTVETDRRSKFRKRPLSLVYVELATGNGGMMRDLCEEGFALRAMMPLRPGEVTSFTFSLDAVTRIEGEGRMIWVEESGRVAGLEFTKISPDCLRYIQIWLQSTEDTPVREAEIPESPAARNSTLEELRQEARTVAARPVASKAEVTIFPAPSKTESPSPPREIPSPEELKKEIAEALRQAAEERMVEEQRPPVYAAPPPPPSPPPPASPRPPEPPPSAHWVRHAPALEPLPSIEDMDFIRGRRSSGFTLSRAIGIMLCIALAVGAYVYRREVGQLMIQFGQKMSGSEEAAGSRSSAGEPSAPVTQSPTTGPSANEARPGSANSVPAGPSATAARSTAPFPGSSGPGASPDGTSGASTSASSGNASPSTTGSDSPASGSQGGSSPKPPSSASPGRQNSSTVLPVSPLIAGGSSSVNAGTNPESGETEYLQALQLLRGKNRAADRVEAARLLWVAVEKGNSNAEVALAELYRLGQGVTQNCDQARVLLTAAARKGNPEGVRHLQLFEQAGCE